MRPAGRFVELFVRERVEGIPKGMLSFLFGAQMERKNQGWLIYKTDQGWEMKTVSNEEDIISVSVGSYWLTPNRIPRAKEQRAGWNYAFHQLPPQVLAWATILQAQTLPINHHDPHNNPKSHKPESESKPEPDTSTDH